MENMSKRNKYEELGEISASLVENAQMVIPDDGVLQKLELAEKEKRPLRVKMGFDPTSPDLHLGHAVAMRRLKKFQELGHLPVIIIGDFTGRIGDPSGRNKSRPLATAQELDQNAETYLEQLGKILDTSNIEVRRNSEWLASMSLEDIIKLLAQGSLSQVITRDDFRKRLESGSTIGLHEIIYPFLQGMDSVSVKADVELGGVDQLYAFQAARMLQGNFAQDPQVSVLMPLLRGLDGVSKMSKSLGNYIGLKDEPNKMFGKTMSIPDSVLGEYLRLASSFDSDTVDRMLSEIVQGRNPMEVKLLLARDITATYHDPEAAENAERFFHNQFRDKTAEPHYEIVEIDTNIDSPIDLLVALGMVGSKSQARRLIEQGGVRINEKRINLEDSSLGVIDGLRIRVGKLHFYKLKAK